MHLFVYKKYTFSNNEKNLFHSLTLNAFPDSVLLYQMEHFLLFASPILVNLIWLIRKKSGSFLFPVPEKGGMVLCVNFYNDCGV